jgi:hypothetical protein
VGGDVHPAQGLGGGTRTKNGVISAFRAFFAGQFCPIKAKSIDPREREGAYLSSTSAARRTLRKCNLPGPKCVCRTIYTHGREVDEQQEPTMQKRADFLGVSEVAERIGVLPRALSDLFYAGKLDADLCPVVAGRRLIPADYLPEIARVVHEHRAKEKNTPVALTH